LRLAGARDKLCSMKLLDRILRDRRFIVASRFMRPDADVLDIGCADGAMFRLLQGRYRYGYGVDPTLDADVSGESYYLYRGEVPGTLPQGIEVDLITMLAVVEHLSPREQAALAEGCHALLKPGGRIVVTVPSPRVDSILHILAKLRLIDGMSMHEHYGFVPQKTVEVFAPPAYRLVQHRKFQLGLNNLFIFEKA
jgi:2-polyprenyl-3-methyl-5-hydroxy-6-metoxy-1,4-benzoquinol methylase